ncbi:MAG: zinc-ribbon domain-containing protein [Candidatus Thermoplasmatota archaeon]|nr:zinc-ribbon domain-containing protein [Candidatus Thermoplasmatota archaeon]
MAAYCNRCERYINQYCDRCGGNAGISYCEMYACGGTMICPICGNNELVARKDFKKDTDGKEEEKPGWSAVKEGKGIHGSQEGRCPVCGFEIKPTWKYCPECGVRFSTLSRTRE